MKRDNRSLTIFDALIVLINIAAGRGNFMLFGLFHQQSTLMVCLLTIIIDIVYIFVRFGGKIFSNISIPPSVFLCEAILFYNFVHMFAIGGNYPVSLLFLVIIIFFSLILNGQISILKISSSPKSDGIRKLSRGYLWISLFSIFGIIISFVLLQINEIQGIPVDADYLSSHDEMGLDHYWTYLTLNSPNSFLRVPFFQDFGILTGLFHEPHILALNVFPCLILLLPFADSSFKRGIIIVLAILMMLFEVSTTNILVVGGCLLLYFLLHFKNHFFSIIISIVVIAYAIYSFYLIDDTLFLVVSGRLDVDNGSQQVSRSLLEYAFTPKTLFGSNILETSFAYGTASNDDVGFIAFFLNIGFLLVYGLNTIKLLLRKDSISEAVAFASLYYILHSAKVGLSMYVQTLPILLVFLQSYLLHYGGNGHIRKSFSN